MKTRSLVRDLTSAAVLLALCVLLPYAFHGIQRAGVIFSPIHIPVFLGGFLLGPLWGGAIGLLGPLLCSIITGMPPMYPTMVNMMIECLAYGLLSGLIFRLFKSKWMLLDIYVGLVPSMLVGRCVGGLMNLITLIGSDSPYTGQAFLNSYFVLAWPGILIQLTVIPFLLFSLYKARVFSGYSRYLFPRKAEEANAKRMDDYFAPKAQDWAEKGPLSDEKASKILAPLGDLTDKAVIDIGCGTGVLEPYLDKHAGSVLAVDVSEAMIVEARKLDLKKTTLMSADFLTLPVVSKAYDAAVCYNSFPHFKDVDGFAMQCAAALRKGGLLLIAFDHGREALNRHHLDHGGEEVARLLSEPKKEAFPFWKEFKLVDSLGSKDTYMLLLKRR